MTKPRAFTFWQNAGPMPAHIALCLDSQRRCLSPAFDWACLDWETCLPLLPERDALWAMTEPATNGKTISTEGRRWALFADLLRIVLLRRFGGLWLDADTLALPPIVHLAPVIESYDFVGQETHKADVMNGCFGGRAGSPILAQLAADLDAHLLQKVEADDLTARWGEYGKALFRNALVQSDPASILILPFGVLTQITPETALDPLNFDGPLDSFLPPIALGITLYNSTMPQKAVLDDPAALRATGSVLAQAYELSVKGASGPCLLSEPAQIALLNRAAVTLPLLAQHQARAATKADLMDKLRRSRERLQEQKDLNKQLRERLRKQPTSPAEDQVEV